MVDSDLEKLLLAVTALLERVEACEQTIVGLQGELAVLKTDKAPKRGRQRMTYEMWAKVHELLAGGATQKAVAEMHKIPVSTVSAYARMTEEAALKLKAETKLAEKTAEATSADSAEDDDENIPF